jgi:Mycothiol maleylpyruvate isomerase N-terminal domain
VNGSGADLASDAEAARSEFLAALDGLTSAQRDAKRLVGEWGVREIVAHLGYWSGNVAEALHHAEQGRAHEFGAEEGEVDDRNEVVARVARDTDMATVRSREEAAFSALLDRLRRADPEWMRLPLADGETIGHLIHEDGIDHYREHAADLRAAAGGQG